MRNVRWTGVVIEGEVRQGQDGQKEQGEGDRKKEREVMGTRDTRENENHVQCMYLRLILLLRGVCQGARRNAESMLPSLGLHWLDSHGIVRRGWEDTLVHRPRISQLTGIGEST